MSTRPWKQGNCMFKIQLLCRHAIFYQMKSKEMCVYVLCDPFLCLSRRIGDVRRHTLGNYGVCKDLVTNFIQFSIYCGGIAAHWVI